MNKLITQLDSTTKFYNTGVVQKVYLIMIFFFRKKIQKNINSKASNSIFVSKDHTRKYFEKKNV